jgi:hypothetical protein
MNKSLAQNNKRPPAKAAATDKSLAKMNKSSERHKAISPSPPSYAGCPGETGASSLRDMVRAGPYINWGLPASAARAQGGAFSVSAARVACQLCGCGRCDQCHWLLLDNPFIFWTWLKYKNPNVAGSKTVEVEEDWGNDKWRCSLSTIS